jgi:hypothetical protein
VECLEPIRSLLQTHEAELNKKTVPQTAGLDQSNRITFLFTLPNIVEYYNQLPIKALFTFGLLLILFALRFTLIL